MAHNKKKGDFSSNMAIVGLKVCCNISEIICLPDDCFHSSSPTRCLLLDAMAWWFCGLHWPSVHLFSARCLLLGALAESFVLVFFSFFTRYICLGVVSCWVPWANDFAVGALAFARGVSDVLAEWFCNMCAFIFFHWSPAWCFLLDALAMSFCISCVCISSPYMLARLQFLIIIISLRHHRPISLDVLLCAFFRFSAPFHIVSSAAFTARKKGKRKKHNMFVPPDWLPCAAGTSPADIIKVDTIKGRHIIRLNGFEASWKETCFKQWIFFWNWGTVFFGLIYKMVLMWTFPCFSFFMWIPECPWWRMTWLEQWLHKNPSVTWNWWNWNRFFWWSVKCT